MEQCWLTKIEALERRLDRIESSVRKAASSPQLGLVSVAQEIEEHLYIASIALLHVALVNSDMAHTVMAADAMRLAYRMEEEGTSDGHER